MKGIRGAVHPVSSPESGVPIIMSADSSTAEAPKSKAETARRRPAAAIVGPPQRVLAILTDAGLVILFLALACLLGVFPLKDTDIFWHLRTGQIIREAGQVPRTDFFTYTREGAPWIDLHWIFQIAVSWLYERGGAVALNIAKCIVTCLAVLILITSRRRDWPMWVTVVAWLPALLVLGGRMYVRPETLSLLYLSVFLAVLTRWDRHPYLVAILPMIQVAWVNSHGLFVLGPIILVMAMLEAALRPGSLAGGARRWWRIAGIGILATFAACLVNPYGIRGAVYPIELAGTMTNTVFSLNIAELTPIPEFIRRAGLGNLPLQLHFLTMALGALSFILPLVWSVAMRFTGPPGVAPAAVGLEAGPAPARSSGRGKEKADARSKSAKKKESSKRRKTGAPQPEAVTTAWRLSPFRLLLFAAFSYLSLQATRNSHQFAAVVGSVTAWNFAEWAAAIRRRRAERTVRNLVPTPARAIILPRLAAAGAIALVLGWVGSGVFYRMTGEGRTIGLGEEPLFFAHEAAKFSGRPEMPAKFISFHNGHASLFEFYNGPGRKVYTDPRLEVAGAARFKEYLDLDQAIKHNEPGWQAKLDQVGRPVVMVDHEYSWAEGATMLGSPQWRCVWFDPIVAVFVHDSAEEAVRQHTVDFAARHFRPDAASRGRTRAERAALARAYRNYVGVIPSHRTDLVWPIVWLGLDECRGILSDEPDSVIGWKMLGQIEIARDPAPAPPPSPRYRLPFDPVADLSMVRATYAMRRTLDLDPYDMTTLMTLEDAYARRGMHEEALEVLDRLQERAARHPAANGLLLLQQLTTKRGHYVGELGETPALEWRNMAELDRLVTTLLSRGRSRTAADILEKANPPERASWDVLDRMATLRLHLGEPARARALWQQGMGGAPVPAVAAARIAATHLAEADFEAARRAYHRALGAKPDLFEACYGLAILELDAGDATAASEMARKAAATAPNDACREAAETIRRAAERFATTVADDGRRENLPATGRGADRLTLRP
jgi:tetratricopeptide (TPR) repeat protein